MEVMMMMMITLMTTWMQQITRDGKGFCGCEGRRYLSWLRRVGRESMLLLHVHRAPGLGHTLTSPMNKHKSTLSQPIVSVESLSCEQE